MHIIKRIKSNKNNVKGLVFEFEDLIFKNVKENYPNNWDDDLITTSLLKDMSALLHAKKVHIPGNVIKTHCWPYKLTADPEHKFSDIAMLFRINYHDGQSVEGAAFLEIKKKDPNKNTFSAIRKDQLKRINSNAPHSQLLLYDYDNITGMAFTTVPESIIGYYPNSWDNWVPYTSAVTVPINLSIALGDKSTSLYKVSVPFSHQFCFRYLYGLDLDYKNIPVETAKGYRTDKGKARYLILVSIAHGGAEPQRDFDFDREGYIEL